MSSIEKINALTILDSRGNRTVEVDAWLADGSKDRAAVPSGASTGSREALDLPGGDARAFGGKGVRKAIGNSTKEIAPALRGHSASEQSAIQLVGDDNFVANPAIIARAIERGVANAAVIKTQLVRHAERDVRGHRWRALPRLRHRHQPPLGRDDRLHRGPHARDGRAPDQDRHSVPGRARGEVQPAAADGGRARRERSLRGDADVSWARVSGKLSTD